MRNLLIAFAFVCIAQSASANFCSDRHRNELSLNPAIPRIEPSKVPNFAVLKPDHFLANLNEATRAAFATIEKLKAIEKPDFKSIVPALERAIQRVRELKELFDSGMIDDMKAYGPLAEPVEAKALNFLTRVYNDAALLKILKGIDQSRLNLEEKRLMDILFSNFKEQGMELSAADRVVFAELREKLGKAYGQFMQNLTAFNKNTKLVVKDVKDLDGVPADVIQNLAAEAKAQGIEGYVISLAGSASGQIRTYCHNESIRKQLWELANKRAFESEVGDNSKVIFEIATLRAQYAKLLGYKSYAEMAIEDRMVGSPANVHKLIRELTEAYKPAAQKEEAELNAFAKEKNGRDIIEPWDDAYYSNLLLKERYSFDDQKVREYLPASRVRDGMFEVIKKLWGIEITSRSDMPVSNETMEMFEVKARTGETLGFIQYDQFARKGEKKPGAWMYGLFSSAQAGGPRVPGFLKVAMNMEKPVEGQPTLMTVDEARTLFHEFGHALHFLVTKSKYSMIAGTSTKHDFVELPSQFFENYFADRGVFQEIARHHKTGEPIPLELIDAMERAEKFQQGLRGLSQLSLQLLDMAWNEGQIHTQQGKPLWQIEQEVTDSVRLRPARYQAVRSASFTHIMYTPITDSVKGGYGGGYYSYKYSQILEAQAFEVFKRHGIFNQAIAMRYLRTILEPGDSVDPLTAFRNFTGEDPNPDALLVRSGIR